MLNEGRQNMYSLVYGLYSTASLRWITHQFYCEKSSDLVIFTFVRSKQKSIDDKYFKEEEEELKQEW